MNLACRILRGGVLASCLLLTACVSGPRAPDWREDTEAALEAYRRHYLAGESAQATRAYAEALRQVSATGDPDRVVRVELIRCGIAAAALDASACARTLRHRVRGEDAAYAAFLAGEQGAEGGGRLPERYRAAATAKGADGQARALRRIDDPLSRLIAAGALYQRGDLPPEGIAIAVDTASEQGYRRALLAWLAVQEAAATAAGDEALAQVARRRIGIASGGVPEP